MSMTGNLVTLGRNSPNDIGVRLGNPSECKKRRFYALAVE